MTLGIMASTWKFWGDTNIQFTAHTKARWASYSSNIGTNRYFFTGSLGSRWQSRRTWVNLVLHKNHNQLLKNHEPKKTTRTYEKRYPTTEDKEATRRRQEGLNRDKTKSHKYRISLLASGYRTRDKNCRAFNLSSVCMRGTGELSSSRIIHISCTPFP